MCPICGQNLSDVKKEMKTDGFSVDKLMDTFAIFKQIPKIETLQSSLDVGKTCQIVNKQIGDVQALHSALSIKYRGTGTVIPIPAGYLDRVRGYGTAFITENGKACRNENTNG